MNLRQRLINPMLEKEFRLRMRTIRSPLALLAYLFVIGIIAFGYLYIEMGNRVTFTPDASRTLFYFLSGAQIVLICFMAPGLTAGVISGEREKQTLNMLLTTQQSSSAIVISKLFAALSFMFLIVFATLPVYSIVFLYGGISPGQLFAVFGIFLLIMITLGSLGVLFSTLFKKTVTAIIMTYGTGMFMYLFTGLAAIFFMAISSGGTSTTRRIAGVLVSMNPLAGMMSVFEPSFSREFFQGGLDGLKLWHIYVPFQIVLSVIAIWLAILYLRPRRKY